MGSSTDGDMGGAVVFATALGSRFNSSTCKRNPLWLELRDSLNKSGAGFIGDASTKPAIYATTRVLKYAVVELVMPE